jgi:hypothetical protein
MRRTEEFGSNMKSALHVWRSWHPPAVGLLLMLAAGQVFCAGVAAADKGVVRDRFWMWAHEAHSYDDAWGLPRNGRITPVEGAHYLGVPNIILIRCAEKPAPPFEQYAVPFKSLKRVFWSVTGAGGATSDEEREHVFQLAASLPNMTGVFMDDFFQLNGSSKPQWLADNNPPFPVYVEVELSEPARLTAVELAQSDWGTGDYRSGNVVLQVPGEGGVWREVARGTLPNTAGAKVKVALNGTSQRRFRVGILNTHDKEGARSCGLSGVKVWADEKVVSLKGAKLRATSSYVGHGPDSLNEEAKAEAPAALSVGQLRKIRDRLVVNGRRLDLGVTLYTYQLDPVIRSHLDYCDVVSLWTWEAKDLGLLEENFARFKALVPNKRALLGCYMWDFGTGKPMPIAAMKKQCEFGLDRIRDGQIEGMIFLASNICDLGLETVDWTRRWIAEVGDQPL